ncbi:MAG: alpha/beta fold hydrolase [Kangiellaceae bacterium]|nr:alpha/beta fold hydrolase [Kangiellaceae bacterium]
MVEALKHTKQLPECISGSLHIESELELNFGDTLYSTVVSYSLYGDKTKPAIVVLGGISADQYVADTIIEGVYVKGWWDALVGHNKAIDLNQYCVVSIDYLDGQSSTRKITKEQQLKISTFDQAQILIHLLKKLELDKFDALIGASYGGMVGLAFAQAYPDKLNQLIVVCCTEKSSSRNTGFRSLQRQILEFAIEHDDTQQGLVLARSLATLGYRGETELENRFENNICSESKTIDLPIVGYLKKQGEKFASRFCAKRFINLSLSVDLHQVDAQKITLPSLCVGIEGDLIAPIDSVKELALKIGSNAQFKLLNSKVGHDGFLKEFSQLSTLIQSNLSAYHSQEI